MVSRLSPTKIICIYGKYSATCIKGHRSSSCTHDDRPLFQVKKKGRPPTQCKKCRDLRKTDKVHSKCVCPERDSNSNCNSTSISDDSKRKNKDENIKLVEPPRKLKKGERAPLPDIAPFPNGLKDAYPHLINLEDFNATTQFYNSKPKDVWLDKLMNPCKCKVGGKCNCSKQPSLNNFLPPLNDLLDNYCKCGPQCSCPGCIQHGNPPLKQEEKNSSNGNATCGCDNMEDFLSKASSLIPFPPSSISTDLSNYMNGNFVGLQSWQQLYEPKNKGIVKLPPLDTDCCGGKCECQARGDECKCDEDCCGCCITCNCSDNANNDNDRNDNYKGEGSCCSGKDNINEFDTSGGSSNQNQQYSPSTLTSALSKPFGLEIPRQLNIKSQLVDNNNHHHHHNHNHWFPKFISPSLNPSSTDMSNTVSSSNQSDFYPSTLINNLDLLSNDNDNNNYNSFEYQQPQSEYQSSQQLEPQPNPGGGSCCSGKKL